MVDFRKLEEDVVKHAEAALRDVVHTAEANEPTIGAAVSSALEAAGVPAPFASVAVGLVENLIAHFTTHATTPVATVTVASAPSAATTDPFAPAATASPATPAG